MNYFKLIYLSIFCGIISILSFFNIIYSYYLNLYLNLNTYVYTFFVSTFLMVVFYYTKNNNNKKTSIYEKIITILFGYFLLPLIIAIPFYLSIYNLAFVDSYFEAISGFTSTGFTIFENIKHIDQGLILWRSSAQWVGGLYFLFSIILLIDIFDHSFKNSLTNFISFNKAETLKQSLKIFLLYSLITLIIFITLNIFNIRYFDALNLSMSIISSGGFLPTNNLSSILLNNSPNNLSLVFLILVIIGGSFFSTSSGIRFLKIYSLFKYSINEILSYSRPKNIFINKHLFSKNSFKQNEIYKYFLSIIIFIISLLCLSALLTINSVEFETAFKLSILTLMNTVNSSMHGLGEFAFYDLNSFTKYYLILFMIIGRIELLTLLIISKKFLFKN